MNRTLAKKNTTDYTESNLNAINNLFYVGGYSNPFLILQLLRLAMCI